MTPAQAMAMRTVIEDVVAERYRQDERWGQQDWPDMSPHDDLAGELLEADARRDLGQAPTFSAILREEVGEALQEIDPVGLREELVQVAAVAVQWIEAIDRRGGAK